jgi:hypothetical protein
LLTAAQGKPQQQLQPFSRGRSPAPVQRCSRTQTPRSSHDISTGAQVPAELAEQSGEGYGSANVDTFARSSTALIVVEDDGDAGSEGYYSSYLYQHTHLTAKTTPAAGVLYEDHGQNQTTDSTRFHSSAQKLNSLRKSVEELDDIIKREQSINIPVSQAEKGTDSVASKIQDNPKTETNTSHGLDKSNLSIEMSRSSPPAYQASPLKSQRQGSSEKPLSQASQAANTHSSTYPGSQAHSRRRRSSSPGTVSSVGSNHSVISTNTHNTQNSRTSQLSQSSLLKPTTSSQRRRQSFGIQMAEDPTLSAIPENDILNFLNANEDMDLGSADEQSPTSGQPQSHTTEASLKERRTLQRRFSFNSSGYNSDTSNTITRGREHAYGHSSTYTFSHQKKPYGTQQRSRTAESLREMQEDPRYSKWNSRYRIPQPHFGFSKPFIHRPNGIFVPQTNTFGQAGEVYNGDVNYEGKGNEGLENAQLVASVASDKARSIPGFEKSVIQMRESFEKLPPRGTLTRASKELPATFYPMDFDDVEALRRSGHFNDSIGGISGKPMDGK